MIRRLACALAVLTVASIAAADSSRLLKDINPSSVNSYHGSDLKLAGSQSGSRFYFGATMSFPFLANGQLWSTDGTPAGSKLVGEIASGAVPMTFVTVGNVTVFFLSDGNGYELWRTDGTAAGTLMVRDINPGLGNGVNTSRGMVRFGNRAAFVGYERDHGEEVWVTDGTAGGTKMLADLAAGPPSSTPYDLTTLPDGSIAFRANGDLYRADAATSSVKQLSENVTIRSITAAGSRIYFEGFTDATGWELWTSDGQSKGGTHIVRDLVPGPASSFSPTEISVQMAALGTKLVFPAIDAQGGNTAWITDGTDAGTHQLGDGTRNHSFVSMGDRVFYLSGDPNKAELWSTDGTSIARLLPPGPSGPRYVGLLTATQHRIFFVSGKQLWSSDGTESGTLQVTHVEESPFIPFVSADEGLTPFNDRVVFRGNDLVHGEEAWASDGTTAGTAMIANASFDEPGSSGASFIGATSRGVFFKASDPFRPGLWLTDGTTEGTRAISPAVPGISTASGERFLFASGANNELWTSDGTTAGTVPIRTFPLASNAGSILDLATNALGTFMLVSDSNLSGASLWKTDGTADGTLKVIDQLLPSPSPAEIAGRIFYFAGWPERSLWTGDGTGAGSTQLTVFPTSDRPGPMIAVRGGAMWLLPEGNDAGTQVWRSDGSVDGTAQVARLTATTRLAFGERPAIAALLDRLIFTLKDDEAGDELWMSDGTTAGTKRLKDIRPGAGSSAPNDFATLDDRLFFSADDGVLGRELWVTDGTEAGTKLVKDIAPGAAASQPRFLTVAGDLLFFTASDGARGTELWQSDGTPEGTRLVDDINPGPGSSLPSSLFVNGNTLYFAATDPVNGNEPRTYTVATPPMLSVADARTTEGITPAIVTVRLSTASAATVTVDWTTVDGNALAGSDYVAANGTLTFEPGETKKQLTIAIPADGIAEVNEVFYVRLSNPTNAKLSRSMAAVVIDDRDRRADLQLSIDGRNIIIRNAGPSTASRVQLKRRGLNTDPPAWSATCAAGCAYGNIRPGETVSVPLPGGVFAPAMEIIGAEVTASEADPNAADNSLTVLVQGESRMRFVTSPAYPIAGKPMQAYLVLSQLSSNLREFTFSSSNALVLQPPASVPYQPSQSILPLTATPLAAGDVTLTVGALTFDGVFNLHVINSGDRLQWTPGMKLDLTYSASTFGDPLTLTAKIPALAPDSGAAPTGTISFMDGNTLLGSAPISGGVAVLAYDSLRPATHQLTAIYNGDANFTRAAATASIFVLQRKPQLAATVLGNTATATVTGVAAGVPSGTLTISENGQVIASALVLRSASATHSAVTLELPPATGTRSLTLAYSGDTNYAATTATVRVGTMKRRTAGR